MISVLFSYLGPTSPSLILVADQEERAPWEQEKVNCEIAESGETASPSPLFPLAGLSSEGGRFKAKSHAEFGILNGDWVLYLLN